MEERLAYLRGVVRFGSFSEAARQLHVSQPALSNAIGKLERELKATLVRRTVSPVTATEAGLVALQAADAMQRQHDTLRADLDRLAEQRPRLRLGLIDSAAALYSRQPDYLPDLVRHYRTHLHVDTTMALLERLYSGQLDMTVAVTVTSVQPEGYSRQPVGSEALVLVAAPALSPARSRRLISYPAGSLTAKLIRQALPRWNIDLTPHTFSTSPDVMLQLVERRMGIAALPAYLVAEAIRHKRLVALAPVRGQVPYIERPISLYSAPYEPMAMTLLSEQVRSTLKAAHDEAAQLLYYKKSS